MIHVWSQSLGLPLMVWSLIRFCRRPVIHYTGRPSAGALRLASLARRLGWRQTVEVRWAEFGVTDSIGRALCYRLEMRLRWMCAALFPEHARTGWLPATERAAAHLWMRLLESDFLHGARNEMAFATAVENLYAETGAGATAVLCFVQMPFLGIHAERCFRPATAISFRLKSMPGLSATLRLAHLLPGSPAVWWRRVVGTILGRPPRPGVRVSDEAVRQGTVFQQAVVSSEALYPAAGHYCWIEGSGIEPGRVVLYCNRSDTVFDDARVEAAARLGVGICDADDPVGYFTHPLRDSLALVVRSLAAFPRDFDRIGFWRWVSFCRHFVLAEAYRAMLRRCNVKAAHQCGEFGPDVNALAIALRHEGGILVANLWSLIPYLLARYERATADLFLAWGPHDQGYCATLFPDLSWTVQVGMISADSSGQGAEANGRARLSPKVTKVVAVFDNNSGPLLHNAAADMVSFYKVALEAVHDHPDWGALIKSKGRAFDSLVGRDVFMPLLEELVRTGRCVVLPPELPPTAATRDADLVVCASVNTAGLTAALAGLRVIHFDFGGLVEHALARRGGDGHIIFRDADAFAGAIRRAFAGDVSIGDHGPWLSFIDPYQDGRGRFRAARIFGDYLRARDEGEDVTGAMIKATQTFAREWGEDKVHSAAVAGETESAKFWREIGGAVGFGGQS